MPSRPSQSRAAAFAVAWLAYFVVLQWSVVRFRVPIVLVLTACALALAAWQWRRSTVEPTPPAVTGMLAGSALATLVVPLFSYLGDTALAVATTALVVGALAAGALLWSGRARAAVPALVASVTAYAVAGTTAVVGDPAPKIDVWVTLQQASDALARGENFYDMTWTGSPGIQDAFTYLPFTTVLLAPGKWLAGDVRWALLAWTLVAAAGAWVLATRLPRGHAAYSSLPGPRWRGAAVVALLLLAPGTLTQLDQAWTEPLLLAGLVWWAVLVDRGTERSAWWAVVPLALACASKQHLAVLLPVLLVWRPFGVRRTLATGALTGLFIAPWFLASPPDFLHDTVTLLVSFPPLKFANTLYLLALNSFGVTLPFWVTGLVVIGTLGAVVAVVWRRQPPLAEVLRWLALVLLVANLVNKQAFYNQFWLAGALVVVSLALAARPAVRSAPDSAGRTATHA
ncbi:glycosyltransferase 87 family protein [Phycicoccus sp. SLBN-51]|uniref:glycosyltransferase 87 family protein n=1 Tax=Phycicoccus sp. SLBN-51 TaxID=2768447 RepID=UPI00114DA91A|nr:glycosyltransferase 87 family protein [Phycicoccus sp. SLBN-51]TQJ50392.1 uncharacterized protein DUF2029 [Phycicoccus sp. SLBN-51]